MKLRPGQELIDKPIISLNEGRFLGNLKGLLLDRELTRIVGLFMGRKGLLKRKTQLIPLSDVQILGIDAILVKKSSSLVDEDAHPEAKEWLRLDELRGRPVNTRGGTRVGLVGDILLADSSRIVGFGLSAVYVEGPIKENRGVMHSAVIDVGLTDGVMTVNMERAEQDRPDNLDLTSKESEE